MLPTMLTMLVLAARKTGTSWHRSHAIAFNFHRLINIYLPSPKKLESGSVCFRQTVPGSRTHGTINCHNPPLSATRVTSRTCCRSARWRLAHMDLGSSLFERDCVDRQLHQVDAVPMLGFEIRVTADQEPSLRGAFNHRQCR